jgi:hypothetical protein
MYFKPLLVSLAVLITALSPLCLHAQTGSDNVVGRWIGVWENSKGGQGRDSLLVTEFPDGRIEGQWGKGYVIAGQRTALDRYTWVCQSGESHYQVTARLIDGGERLLVGYRVNTFRDGRPESYTGRSQLSRAGFRPY